MCAEPRDAITNDRITFQHVNNFLNWSAIK